MSTNITGIVKSTVSVTPGPDWATNLNTSLDAIDAHDHTSNKGVRIVPSAININAALEFNGNNLGPEGGIALVKALKRNNTLRRLESAAQPLNTPAQP